MDQPTAGVIKKERIKEGQAVRIGPAEAPDPSTAQAAPATTAKIVTQAEDGVIVEVQCECGRTIVLKCECEPTLQLQTTGE